MKNIVFVILIILCLTITLCIYTQVSKPLYDCPHLDKLIKSYTNNVYAKVGNKDYWVYEIPNFLPHETCDAIINKAVKAGLSPSNVYNNGIDELDENSRKSLQTWFNSSCKYNNDIENSISAITNIPKDHMESLQVVYYPPGGYFGAHYDPDISNLNESIAHRQGTFIVYLNDDFEGGGTRFPKLNYTVKPEKGKAVIFWSLNKDNSIIDHALHEAEPVLNGSKWVCNKWLHNRKL